MLLSTALRLFRLTDQSLWYDEAFDVLFAQRSFSTILAETANDTMPPLHYILLHTWMRIGSGEFVAKLFSVFMGVLATAATYHVGRLLLNPWVALGGALLLAISPFQIHYAREVRMYSQLLFFGLMSVAFFVRCLRNQGEGTWPKHGARRRGWIGLIVFSALVVYTHTLGFLIPLAIGTVAFAFQWRSREFVWRLLLSGLAVTLLASPWILLALPAQASRVVQTFWVSRPTVLAPLVTLHMFLVGYAIPPLWTPVALFVTLALGSIALYQALRTASRPLVFLVTWLIGPIALVWLLSLLVPMYLDRLFIACAPALYLLLAWSLRRTPFGLSLPLGGLLFGLILLSLGHYYFDSNFHKPAMRDAAVHVREQALPGDVVLHTSDSSFLTFIFYEPQLQHFLIKGDPGHGPGSARAQAIDLLGFGTVTYERVLAENKRVWLVVALDHSVEFQQQAAKEMTETRVPAYEASVQGILVYLLSE